MKLAKDKTKITFTKSPLSNHLSQITFTKSPLQNQKKTNIHLFNLMKTPLNFSISVALADEIEKLSVFPKKTKKRKMMFNFFELKGLDDSVAYSK